MSPFSYLLSNFNRYYQKEQNKYVETKETICVETSKNNIKKYEGVSDIICLNEIIKLHCYNIIFSEKINDILADIF